MFNYLPITFYIEVNAPDNDTLNLSPALYNFASLFQVLKANRGQIGQLHASPAKLRAPGKLIRGVRGDRRIAQLVPTGYGHRGVPQYIKYTMPFCHFSGRNLWLLKPTSLNRGRGIHVFDSLERLKEILTEDCEQALAERQKLDPYYMKCYKTPDRCESQNASSTQSKRRLPPRPLTSFIIQKYIECPLLVRGRKFDIRMWALVTQEMDAYLFKEGYIRTSSEEYRLDDVDNRFVHLTNNAVQQFAKNYGQFEDGNQMSFQRFQDYLVEAYPGRKISFAGDIFPQIRNLVKKSMLATRKRLNPENRRNTFEIFGYDFMIDSDFAVWLIEVNTNPCLEESSGLLRTLLPRMLDDAFKLTVDVGYPPRGRHSAVHPVSGYKDDESMWEKLCSGSDHPNTVTTTVPATMRSEYTIVVNEDRMLSVCKTASLLKGPKKGKSAGKPKTEGSVSLSKELLPSLDADADRPRDNLAA